jgi:hypothetical protein
MKMPGWGQKIIGKVEHVQRPSLGYLSLEEKFVGTCVAPIPTFRPMWPVVSAPQTLMTI